jgi:hypothetical protein
MDFRAWQLGPGPIQLHTAGGQCTVLTATKHPPMGKSHSQQQWMHGTEGACPVLAAEGPAAIVLTSGSAWGFPMGGRVKQGSPGWK